MKIRKLVAATDANCCDHEQEGCTISAQQDYDGAISCIESAINLLAHTVHCDENDIVAKESIANLAVVLLDLKSAHSAEVVETPDSIPVENVIEDQV